MDFGYFHFYMLSFFIGLMYAVVSAILGGLLGGDVGGDHDLGVGGHDFDPSLHLEPGMVHFSPLSPTIIATFLAAFGATGMICIEVFKVPEFPSIGISVGVALGVSTVMFWFMQWVFQKTQGSTNIESGCLVGERADVITPIPEGGVGEIAYVVRGTRQNAPARSVDGHAIESPAEVEIVRVIGSSFVVRRVPTEGRATETRIDNLREG